MHSNAISSKSVNIFYCYAREDSGLQKDLEHHLSNLRWQGFITESHNFDISPGLEWEKEEADRLDKADIILLLISKDFMASYYAHEVQMRRAIERHNEGSARVIPILLRPVAWEGAPFSNLQVLPTNKKPVTEWTPNKDRAYVDIYKGIKRVVSEFLEDAEKNQPKQSAAKPSAGMKEGLFMAQSSGINSQIVVDHQPLSQIPYHQSMTSSQRPQEAVNVPSYLDRSQNMREASENWLHLRWLIFGSAIATCLVYLPGLIFHMPTIIELCLIPGVFCVILGIIETSHFGQWYWLVGFLVISPLIGVLYAIVCPDRKPQQPINRRQLIIMLSFLGYAFCVVSIIFSSSLHDFSLLMVYMSITLVLSAWLIRLIHLIRAKGFGEHVVPFFIPFTFPFAALFDLSDLDSQ